MSILPSMYNCSGGMNACGNYSPSPRFPASCPLCFAKTIPHCLQQSSVCVALHPPFLCSLKLKQIFFFNFDNIHILYVILLDAGSITGAGSSCYPVFVICHMLLLSSSYLYKCFSASHGILRQPEERLYCVVKTHPSSQLYHCERSCNLYWVCALNFHRLSCFLSYPAVTGCISNAHAICEMSSQGFDDEKKAYRLLYSDRREMQSVLICNQRFCRNFMGRWSS